MIAIVNSGATWLHGRICSQQSTLSTVRVRVALNGKASQMFTLDDLLWVLDLCGNLLSVKKFTKEGYAVKFDQHDV
jgi:hypothetical protein